MTDLAPQLEPAHGRQPGGRGNRDLMRDAAVVDAYRRPGATLHSVGAVFGIHYSRVSQILTRMGEQRRPSGNRPGFGRPPKAERNAAIVAAMRAPGAKQADVARAFGIGQPRVSLILKRHRERP